MRIIALLISLSILPSTARASLVTVGDLSYENTGSTIASGSGYTYSSFNQTGLAYSSLLLLLADTTSEWYGYKVATSEDADRFVDSAFSGTSLCGVSSPHGLLCGTLSGWSDGSFGESWSTESDYFFYISTQRTPGMTAAEVGQLAIYDTGDVNSYDDWGSTATADNYTQRTESINYLLVKANVPEPSAIALIGLGFLGFGVARRKQKKD